MIHYILYDYKNKKSIMCCLQLINDTCSPLVPVQRTKSLRLKGRRLTRIDGLDRRVFFESPRQSGHYCSLILFDAPVDPGIPGEPSQWLFRASSPTAHTEPLPSTRWCGWTIHQLDAPPPVHHTPDHDSHALFPEDPRPRTI